MDILKSFDSLLPLVKPARPYFHLISFTFFNPSICYKAAGNS